MRRRAALVVFCSVPAFAFASTRAGDARADSCSGVISTCINDDVLWPHAGAGVFEAIGSGRTVAAGRLAFGLVTSYVSRPIELELVAPGQGTDQNAVNDQVNGTFLYAFGVTDRVELDVALPLTFGQGGTGLTPVTGGAGLKDTAVRDLRFGVAVDVLKMEPEGAATTRGGVVARFEMSAPTGDEDQFAGEETAVYLPSVSTEWHVGDWFVGGEAGLRVRPITQLLGARIGTQIVVAVGAGYDILPRGLLSAQIEAWALPTFAEQEAPTNVGNATDWAPDGSYITPAEWQLSVRSAPLARGDLAIDLGGGTGIPFGGGLPITTPRFRFTFGLRWAPTQ
jgi:OOP family OmpA-OmpF porin